MATSLPLREDRFLLPSHPSTGLVLPTLRRATPSRPWMLCSRRDHCCLPSPAPVGDSPNLSQCSHSLGTVLRSLPDLCARGSLAAGMLQFGTRWTGWAPTGRNNVQLWGATDSRESGRGQGIQQNGGACDRILWWNCFDGRDGLVSSGSMVLGGDLPTASRRFPDSVAHWCSSDSNWDTGRAHRAIVEDRHRLRTSLSRFLFVILLDV